MTEIKKRFSDANPSIPLLTGTYTIAYHYMTTIVLHKINIAVEGLKNHHGLSFNFVHFFDAVKMVPLSMVDAYRITKINKNIRSIPSKEDSIMFLESFEVTVT